MDEAGLLTVTWICAEPAARSAGTAARCHASRMPRMWMLSIGEIAGTF
jgi:hypothetical protein